MFVYFYLIFQKCADSAEARDIKSSIMYEPVIPSVEIQSIKYLIKHHIRFILKHMCHWSYMNK